MSSTLVDPASAKVTAVSASTGRVFGWAVDKDDLTKQVVVKIYLDGDAASGTLVETDTANRSGSDGNHEGNHRFMFSVPESYRDGVAHDMNIYLELAGDDELLVETTFTAYTPKAQAYYDANVKPKLDGCKNCHTVQYDTQYGALISPAKHQGATAVKNELINKAGRLNGTAHSGGNFCNGIDNSPCAEIQEWWKREFQ